MGSSTLSADDLAFLERTLELAERGRPTAAPNPVVGCVLVDAAGQPAGEGWHERAGGPHAEIVALEAAGDRAAGATAYISLEPCAHHGKTRPCADALVDAQIGRVVCASLDPNPRVDGRGIERLRAAGVRVDVAEGPLAVRARVQNEAFRVWVRHGRPFVIYKAAMTVDGRLAASGGDARWVSGERSRRRVHELRAAVDAVAVGAGTALADAPQLTARGVGADRQPRRLAFSRGDPLSDTGLEVLSGPLEKELARLAAEGVQSLLLEGGPTLAGSFLRQGLIDKVVFFVAPKIVGGDDAPPVFRGAGARAMSQALSLHQVSYDACGDDLLVVGYVRAP